MAGLGKVFSGFSVISRRVYVQKKLDYKYLWNNILRIGSGAAPLSTGQTDIGVWGSHGSRKTGCKSLRRVLSSVSNLSSYTNCGKEDREALEQCFETLNIKLERLGRLNKCDMRRSVQCVEQQQQHLRGQDTLRLLQYALRMIQTEYRPTSSLLDRIWQLATNSPNADLTLEHFEVYLEACLLSQAPCNVEDLLNLLKIRQLGVSEAVLDAMMVVKGRAGQVGTTARLLTIRKQHHLPLTETTFSAIILAHAVNRDSESVQHILDAMRSVKVQPSSVTQQALMTAYAMTGQMEELKGVAEEMVRDGGVAGIPATSIIFTLITHGHSGDNYENLDYMMELVRGSVGSVELSRLLLRLISHGWPRQAVHLLPLLPLIKNNNHLYSNAKIYIQEMVQAGTNGELLIELCEQLHREGINRFGLQVAYECVVRQQKEELAWQVLGALRRRDEPLRQHYFWPLLCLSANKPSRLVECVDRMVELGQPPEAETLKDYILPSLVGQPAEVTMQMLTEAGLSVTAVTTPLLAALITTTRITEALNFVRQVKVGVEVGEVVAPLARAWHSQPRTAVTLLALLTRQAGRRQSRPTEDWPGQFVLHLMASRAAPGTHQVLPLFQEMKKNELTISAHSADLLLMRSNQAVQQVVRKHLHLILSQRTPAPPTDHEEHFPHPDNMSGEELEGHLQELRARGLNTRGILRKLLLHAASKGRTHQVLALMKTAKEEGMAVSAGMLSSILMIYVQQKEVDAALSMFTHIHTQHPHFLLDSFKVVDLCTLLITANKSAEALEILEKYLKKDRGQQRDPRNTQRNCRELLMAAASTGDYDLTQHCFKLLHEFNLLKADRVTLGPLVKCKLNSGDVGGAVREVRQCQQQYGLLPLKREVLIHLINHTREQGTDTDTALSAHNLLQEMIDLITSCFGRTNAEHERLFAYLEAGYPADARRVLQNLGEELNTGMINQAVERYVKTGRDEVLLHLLTASRDLSSLHRSYLYSSLLRIYYVQNAGDMGLALWTLMQEENITPPSHFLSTLASLLSANNIKIPFQV